MRLKRVRVVDERGQPAPEIDIREPVFVEVDYWNLSDDPEFRPFPQVHVSNAEGNLLFLSSSFNNLNWKAQPRSRGIVHTRCRIPGNFLAEGGVFITAAVVSYRPALVHVIETDAVAFHVVDPSEGDGVRGEWTGDYPGLVTAHVGMGGSRGAVRVSSPRSASLGLESSVVRQAARRLRLVTRFRRDYVDRLDVAPAIEERIFLQQGAGAVAPRAR